ncbi:hypothetical protein EFJ91_20210 [Escherichia coli]|nr:hypothetical protein [Escherichia coli]MCH7169865.1 hypothetical protein [Escherichia coli]MCH7189245.1 hypothetical protein [Escherichia coli]MCH7203837.1 hypothetical protein [Escherichia coli]MCH7213694.1 hypothetical protein [Escherichia coli]
MLKKYLLVSEHNKTETSASRSKRTRRLACVGLGVFKEVLVVTGCCVPFLQNKITETIPNSCIESLTRQPYIYQDWCASNTGGCRAGSQMCAGYCGCNGNLLSCWVMTPTY